MGDVEDLSIKAARLWLEFLQAQAKAAASAAQRLPEVARAWTAGAGMPQAREINDRVEVQTGQPDTAEPADEPLARAQQPSQAPRAGSTNMEGAPPALLARANHRRLKPMQKSLARRRMRRS